jgi:ArsR family transcriptional regulator
MTDVLYNHIPNPLYFRHVFGYTNTYGLITNWFATLFSDQPYPRQRTCAYTSNMKNYPSLDELNLLHASLCRALGDPKRILILYVLNDRPRHVTALADALDMPQPTVSRHLRRLEQHSIVSSERDGPSVVYSVTNARIMDLLDLLREVSCDAIAQQSSLLAGSARMEEAI